MGVSGQRHAPAALYPRERTPGTHWTGGWVGPRAGLDTEDRGKILCPCRESNLDRPVVQPVVRHYTAWANPAPGAWGERRYSSYSFTTSALDGGEWSASRPGRALTPGNDPQEAGWAPQPVWTQRLEEKFFRLSRGSNLYRPVVQSVVRHYTDWVTRPS
jgi:hypothetical protein